MRTSLFARSLPLSLLLLSGPVAAQCPLQLDASRWEEVFRDDFTGPALDTSRWDTTPRQPGQPLFGWGCEWYDARDTSLVRQGGGVLHLRATRWRRPDGSPLDSTDYTWPDRQYPQLQYRAGMINLKQRLIRESYGAYEARLKLPATVGAWPAFWLWSYPTEIDIVDGVEYGGPHNGILNNVIDNLPRTARLAPGGHFLEPHPNPPALPYCGNRVEQVPVGPHAYARLDTLTTSFNTFTLVWTPAEVRFYINGRPTFAVSQAEVGTVQDYVTLMVTMQMYPWATGDDAGLDVDYVRILKPRPGADGHRPYASTPATDPACVLRPRTRWQRLWGRF